MKKSEKIAALLKVAGVSPANLGWKYLTDAITMSIKDRSVLDGITKVLYPAIGEKYGCTRTSVERSIRHAVNNAFNNIPDDVKYEIFGNTANHGVVSNSEFIGTLAELIIDEPNNPIWKRTK